jgi:hypothetical protein
VLQSDSTITEEEVHGKAQSPIKQSVTSKERKGFQSQKQDKIKKTLSHLLTKQRHKNKDKKLLGKDDKDSGSQAFNFTNIMQVNSLKAMADQRATKGLLSSELSARN